MATAARTKTATGAQSAAAAVAAMTAAAAATVMVATATRNAEQKCNERAEHCECGRERSERVYRRKLSASCVCGDGNAAPADQMLELAADARVLAGCRRAAVTAGGDGGDGGRPEYARARVLIARTRKQSIKRRVYTR